MRMVNKVFFFMVMFILAAFLGNSQGVCLAQPADNTKINIRDSSPTELTADQQGQTEEDIEITQKIRQAVVNDESLSINAQNVKIITIDRVVTLKGPVNRHCRHADGLWQR
jgi:osmotically-inducible protein OsmY